MCATTTQPEDPPPPPPPPRTMKHTLYVKHRATVDPLLSDGNLKDTLHSIHTTVVNKAVAKQKKNRVLEGLPPPISNNEANLTRRQRMTLSQLRSGHCISWTSTRRGSVRTTQTAAQTVEQSLKKAATYSTVHLIRRD